MPSYVVLGQWTEKGIQKVKESPKRLGAVKKAIEKAGGKMASFYLTMGRYDFVTVIEAPNDQAVAKVLLTTGMQGNVHTETLKAFSESEYTKLVSELP